MCLEQTINRSSKTSRGIIGNTKRKEFVARWNIIHHELMSVNHVFRKIAGVPLHNTELTVNYTLNFKQIQGNEIKVRKMMAYVLKYENPFKIEDSTELTLHNFLTSAIMPDTVRTGLLSLKESGAKVYSTFRKEQFVDRSKRLSDVIPRTNLKTFSSIEGKKKVSSKIQNKLDKKDIGSGQKKLDIARVQGHDPHEVFKYDLVKRSYLFSDENGLMKKPANH